MLRLRPELHPHSPSPIERIEVTLERAGDVLHLSYAISGAMREVRIPPHQPSARTNGLWKHSCFEVFLAAEPGYYEYNFSPSSCWAAYRFDGHRQGMRDAASDDPAIVWDAEMRRLTATIRLPADLAGPIGLSAVIEDTGGNRSFWALAHPHGPPDFHDAACFAAELPPAD